MSTNTVWCSSLDKTSRNYTEEGADQTPLFSTHVFRKICGDIIVMVNGKTRILYTYICMTIVINYYSYCVYYYYYLLIYIYTYIFNHSHAGGRNPMYSAIMSNGFHFGWHYEDQWVFNFLRPLFILLAPRQFPRAMPSAKQKPAADRVVQSPEGPPREGDRILQVKSD